MYVYIYKYIKHMCISICTRTYVHIHMYTCSFICLCISILIYLLSKASEVGRYGRKAGFEHMEVGPHYRSQDGGNKYKGAYYKLNHNIETRIT